MDVDMMRPFFCVFREGAAPSLRTIGSPVYPSTCISTLIGTPWTDLKDMSYLV